MVWGTQHGQVIMQSGQRMLKKPNPVYLKQMFSDFHVATNEGTMSGRAGDFVAYDPITGHVWPISADYVAQHYEEMPDDGHQDEAKLLTAEDLGAGEQTPAEEQEPGDYQAPTEEPFERVGGESDATAVEGAEYSETDVHAGGDISEGQEGY